MIGERCFRRSINHKSYNTNDIHLTKQNPDILYIVKEYETMQVQSRLHLYHLLYI